MKKWKRALGNIVFLGPPAARFRQDVTYVWNYIESLERQLEGYNVSGGEIMADKKKSSKKIEVEPGDDVAQAQPSIEEDTGGGTSGSIQGGAGGAPGDGGTTPAGNPQ